MTASLPRRDSTTHLIGLLLGTENDWPTAFETLTRRLAPVTYRGRAASRRHRADHDRAVRPARPGAPRRRDRPAGLVVLPPPGVAEEGRAGQRHLPAEQPVHLPGDGEALRLLRDDPARASTSRTPCWCRTRTRSTTRSGRTRPRPTTCPSISTRWPVAGRLPDVHEAVRRRRLAGVSRVDDVDDLHRAYDESGQMLMHLQAAAAYDSFARSLTIGPETKIMKFRPELPMHDRYEVAHDFLPPEAGMEILTLSRTINAFFRWEFNSCESLVTGTRVRPIDYANACPDIAITSLHYYFPWAITQLVSWSVFCAVTEPTAAGGHHVSVLVRRRRRPGPELVRQAGPVRADGRPATSRRTPTASSAPPRSPRCRRSSTSGSPPRTSTALLVETVRKTYPPHEHEKFLAHFHGLLGMWIKDQPVEITRRSRPPAAVPGRSGSGRRSRRRTGRRCRGTRCGSCPRR